MVLKAFHYWRHWWTAAIWLLVIAGALNLWLGWDATATQIAVGAGWGVFWLCATFTILEYQRLRRSR